MHQLKLTNNKPHRKSASVVGEVLATLHPHGDSSVYGAMVRLAQPFSLNYPLVDGHGNFGNIDGDPAAAYRYCITGDTLIKTNKGTLPIKDLEQYSEKEVLKDIEVVDFHGNFVPATRFFDSGEHEIFELILRNGQKLKGTGNHPVLILDKKAFKPRWEKMEDLTGEEQVIVPYYNGYEETNIPKETGSLEARALGVMVSEGYITTQNRIGVNNTDKEMVSVVRDFFASETGTTANITEREGIFEFCFANKEYYNKFIDKYNYEPQADRKYIPANLWSSPVHDKAAFLSYLFEGDGSAIKSNNHICYSSYSERLVREIQIMLLQDFSIFSAISKSSKEYQLIISGADVLSWNGKIGFVSERKQNDSMLIEKNYKGLNKIAHNSYHSTKAISDYFRTINNSYFMRKNSFSNIKNIDKAKDIIDKDEFNRVKKLMENFMFVDVKSIEKTNEKETVYSIRVDNLESDHSFIANGFINHNTEARPTKITEAILKDLDKDTVDWKPNFSEEAVEPVVLPARLPHLLINGTTGIAVGMACSFVPHNLDKTVAAIDAYIKNNDITHAELLDIVGGPEFPTGGLVINQDELLEGYTTGRGRVRIRGRYKLEKRGDTDLVVFYEVPYMTRKSKIAEDIAKLAEAKEIEGITDVRDESAQDIRLVIEVAKGFSPESVAETLYARTQLENTYSINNTCLVDGQPQTLSFKDLIAHYVAFQEEVVTRRTEFDMNKINKRIEIVNGLIIALGDVNEVIKIIRQSESSQVARESLEKKYLLTKRQSKSILAMRLSSLTKLEVEELQKEKTQLEEKHAELTSILGSQEVLDNVIITEMKGFAQPFSNEKVTEITQITVTKEEREKLTKIIEDVNISIDKDTIVSFVASNQFKTRANKEKSMYQLETDTGENLIVFTSNGIVYRVPVKDLQRGDSLARILETGADDRIVSVLTEKDKKYIVFLTEQGMLKKTDLEEYENIRRTGVIGIRLRDGDRVSAIKAIDDEPIIVLADDGQTIRFETNQIASIGRNALGVKAINLNEGAIAVDFSTDNEDKEYFVTISENGIIKKSPKTDYPMQGRNGKGVIGLDLRDGDRAFGICEATDTEEIIVYATNRVAKSKVKDLSEFSRNSIGNIFIKDGGVTNIHLV